MDPNKFFFLKGKDFPAKLRLLQLLFRVEGFQWNQRQQGSTFLDGLFRPYDLVVTPLVTYKDLGSIFWLYIFPIRIPNGDERYISNLYMNFVDFSMVNVGKYTSPMDPYGYGVCIW